MISTILPLAFVLVSAATAVAEPKKPYAIKSGSYELEPLVQGMQQVVYFDDFGRKKATYITVDIMGHVKHTLKLELADGTSYDINLEDKTGTKMKLDPSMAAAIGGMITPAMLKDASAKPLPSRKLLGHDTEGIEVHAMGMTVRVFTWKGIPLHTELLKSPNDPKPMTFDVNKITEGNVPASKFEVPAGIKLD